MSKSDSSAESDVHRLSKKVIEALGENGWHKCKSVNDEVGGIAETYSKGERLLELAERHSMAIGSGLDITIATSQVPDDDVQTENPLVSITPHWKTYRDPSLGFEIRYPPNWSVASVEAGSGAIKTIRTCGYKNCLRMRLSVDEYSGDALYVTITPKIDFEDTWARATESTNRIGQYPTREVREAYSGWDLCSRGLTLLTTVGGYRYQFRPEPSTLLRDSFRMKEVYLKILSTVRITPEYIVPYATTPAN